MQQFVPPAGRIRNVSGAADMWEGTTPAYRQHLLQLQLAAQQQAAVQQELAQVLKSKQVSELHLMGVQHNLPSADGSAAADVPPQAVAGGEQGQQIVGGAQQAQLFDLATRIQYFHEQQQQMAMRHAKGKEQLSALEKQRVIPEQQQLAPLAGNSEQQEPAAVPPQDIDLAGVSETYRAHLVAKQRAQQEFDEETKRLSRARLTSPFYHSWNGALNVDRVRQMHRGSRLNVRASWSGR